MHTLHRLILIAMCFTTLSAAAQAPDYAGRAPGANALWEAGFHLGNLLPNQIDGVSEIMGLGGVRTGLRLAPGSYLEGGFIAGNGEGQKWKNVHVDLRMDIPVENLVGVAYIGVDSILYEGNGRGEKLVFGGHAGGGVQSHLSGSTWFRADMKFGFSPGTSLYIGVGFVWRLGGGAGAGAG